MRRLAALSLLALTACSCGGGAAGPAVVAEAPPPRAATASPPAVPTPEVSAVPTPTNLATLAGTVTYLARIALTPEAVVQVELRDASAEESEAPPIARQVVRHPGQVPIAFALEYDSSAIFPGHPYAVSARITDRGQLQFVTEASIAVITRGAPSTAEIVVVPVR